MKRLLFLGVGSALIFTMGGVGPAQADAGPHRSTAATVGGDYSLSNVGAGRCASCHRTHTAKAADLLKEAQPGLCYTCHAAGVGASTNVVDGADNYTGEALRGGGFENAMIGAGAASKHLEPGVPRFVASAQTVPVGASETTTSRHEIDGVTSGTMWGNGAISPTANPGKAAVTLECGSCHDPHGNGNYRILKPVPVDSANGIVITPAIIANPTAVPPIVGVPAVMGPVGVKIPDAVAKVYTTNNYWNVGDANVPKTTVAASDGTFADGYIANASQWCLTCHTRYLAKAPDYKTDSGDAIFTYRHTSARIDKAGVGRPNCIQCHVAHGSNAAMSGTATLVPFPGAAVDTRGNAVTPSADSRLLRIDQRGVCVMCHNV